MKNIFSSFFSSASAPKTSAPSYTQPAAPSPAPNFFSPAPSVNPVTVNNAAVLEARSQQKLEKLMRGNVIVMDETAFLSDYSIPFLKHLCDEMNGGICLPQGVKNNLDSHVRYNDSSAQIKFNMLQHIEKTGHTLPMAGDVGTAVLNLLAKYNVLLVTSDADLAQRLLAKASAMGGHTLSVQQINQYGYLSPLIREQQPAPAPSFISPMMQGAAPSYPQNTQTVPQGMPKFFR